jgi:hypothetical protein
VITTDADLVHARGVESEAAQRLLLGCCAEHKHRCETLQRSLQRCCFSQVRAREFRQRKHFARARAWSAERARAVEQIQ